MMLCRALGNWFSPAGSRAALSILIFHRVLTRPDPLVPGEADAERFERILSWLERTFTVVPLERAIDALDGGSLPARAVAVTFDDGYADNVNIALPILLRHRMSATFFVASGYLDGGRMWNDTVIEAVRRYQERSLDLTSLGMGAYETGSNIAKLASIDRLIVQLKYRTPKERSERATEIGLIAGATLPDDLMMTSAQVRELRSAGMQIGGHTRNHPILATLDDRSAYEEIAAGKEELEAILGERISLFAYPNGRPQHDFRGEHASMVSRAGFSAAVSTSPGVARAGTDPFQLPRFTPWDRSEIRFGLRLLDNMRTAGRIAA